MIFVTTGTHHQPFDRLVAAAEALAQQGERVVVQAGASLVSTPSCERYAWLAPDVVSALVDEADVMITHTGPASLFLAWDRGQTPIIVPRRAAFGEHVDDHQVRFAAWLREHEPRALVVDDPERLTADWSDLRARAARRFPPMGDERSRHFAAALSRRIDLLLDKRGGGLRASLSRLFSSRRGRP